ncbi:hypothetical protein CNMCM7691_005110 [Aspergillus felis]|uniref:Major facilitator superfamily (MFS) profile domain-containing protein n=1 Tax=Aspergillus felis TaxID=1287682 RepID=A0A8H6R4B5_9EURO|nr:hypothetical protein CNMCM7691_005110 [Aspergillus felis]
MLIMLILRVPEQTTKPPMSSVLVKLPRKLDLLGFALFAIACTMFLTAINWGGATYPWSSAKVIGLLCGSGGILALFITWAIHQGDEALIPPHILQERNLFFGCWISGLQGGATIMVGYYLPLWFQAVKGASPTDSGLMMLPTMISQILGSITSGAVVRKLHYVPPWAIIGSVMTAVGTGLITTFTADMSKGKWIGYQIIAGFGRGAALNMPIVASQEYLSRDSIAIASSAIALCQYLTGSVAISVAQAIFQNRLTPALEKYAPNVDPAIILDAGATGYADILPADQLPGVRLAYNEALVKVFFLPTATAAVAALLSFGFSWKKIGVEEHKEMPPAVSDHVQILTPFITFLKAPRPLTLHEACSISMDGAFVRLHPQVACLAIILFSHTVVSHNRLVTMLEEASPLLGGQRRAASRWSSIYWLSTVVFCLSAAGFMLNVPLTQLIEENICTRYAPQGAPTERHCKSDEIQSKLAYLNGNLSLVEAVVGLFVAFPFGVLADRVGRKPVIFLSVIGTSLALAWELAVIAFPKIVQVQAILAGPLFTVVGGGNTVLLANLYSIASDLVAQSDRASAFFLMAFSSLVGACLGPALSSKLMETFSPWIAAFASFFVNLIAWIPLFFVPETLSISKPDSDDDSHLEESQPDSFKFHLSQSLQLLIAYLGSLKSCSMALVLATFLTVAPEILGTSQFMAQYISKRFDWPLAETGYLLTLRGVIHMAVLLFILPLLSKLLLRYRNPAVKDLILARASVVFAAVGALCMAAPQIRVVMAGLAVHSLGSGLAPLCRSLATTYVAPQDTSKLNTVIGIVETTGSLFAGPALAWLFETGMRLGGLMLVRTPPLEEVRDSD